MLRPVVLVLTGVPQVVAVGPAFGESVGGDQCPLQGQVGQLLGVRGGQDLVQLRCLAGEHVDVLVQVAVGGGLGEAVIAGQVGDPARVAEPAQDELGLSPGRAGPLGRPEIVGPAMPVQQTGEEGQSFDRHVTDGRVGENVGPLQWMAFWRFPSCSRALGHASSRFSLTLAASWPIILVRKPHCGRERICMGCFPGMGTQRSEGIWSLRTRPRLARDPRVGPNEAIANCAQAAWPWRQPRRSRQRGVHGRAAYRVAFVWRACHTRYADDKRPRGPLPSPGIVGTTLFQALSPPPCPTAGTSSPGPVRCPGRTNGTTARQGCGALPRGRSPPPGDPRMMMPPIHTV